MTRVTVGIWGDSLAVRLPGEIVEAVRLREGEQLEIVTEEGDIVIRREPCFSLDEMFQGKSPEAWRSEYSAAYDWGPDVGRESVDE